MSNSRTTSVTTDKSGAITEETDTVARSDSDSITIKTSATGAVSWEIKGYGVIDGGVQSGQLRNRVASIHHDLLQQFPRDAK